MLNFIPLVEADHFGAAGENSAKAQGRMGFQRPLFWRLLL